MLDIGGRTTYLSGTSASAPAIAGMLSNINAALITKGINDFLT